MQAQLSTIDPVTVELHVEVPWDRIQKGMEAEFGKLQKTARIKGFRQGKAPRNVIVQLFTKNVREEVVSNVVNQSVVEAVQQHELPVVSSPVLKDAPKFVDGGPLSFSVKVEVRPKIESLDTSLALVRRTRAVGDTEVDAEIERMRQTHAVVEPLETARPSQKGDILTVDFTLAVDGVAQPDENTSQRIELGGANLLPELNEGLTGVNVGDVKTISVTRPADEKNTELAGKVITFNVTVKAVHERKLPALDDEFAKDVGGEFKTFAELRGKTKERLEESAKSQAERALRDAAVDAFGEKNEIPVPPSLLDQQLRGMLQEFMQLFRQMGQQPQINNAMVEELKPRAAAKVRQALLLSELARKENITVSAEDVESRLKEMADRTGKHIAKLRVEYQGEKREQLENGLLEDKLIKHLLAGATITDGPFEAPNQETA